MIEVQTHVPSLSYFNEAPAGLVCTCIIPMGNIPVIGCLEHSALNLWPHSTQLPVKAGMAQYGPVSFEFDLHIETKSVGSEDFL